MCVNCDDNTTTIPQGNDGDQGPAGNDGIFGGFSGEWLFSTSTSSGPAATFLRFDNATYGSVTNIYIADSNADSIDYSSFLASFSNNSNFGYIRIFKEFDSTKFWLGEVTSVTDNGTDYTIGVTYIMHNSTFAANDNVVVSFTGRGRAPATYEQRINTLFQKQDTPYTSTTSGSFVDIGTVVWDINTFSYPITAKLVVKPNTIGHTYDVKLTDNSGNILWNTNFIAASTSKQIIDLGARLISPVAAVKYIDIAIKSDGVNELRAYSIDLYNQ